MLNALYWFDLRQNADGEKRTSWARTFLEAAQNRVGGTVSACCTRPMPDAMSTSFDSPLSVRLDAASPRQQERQQILNRLRRAEGQLRGLQRMIEEGADCMAVVTQLAAVRRALESTQLRMTRCHLLERMRQDAGVANPEAVDQILDEMETLIGRVR